MIIIYLNPCFSLSVSKDIADELWLFGPMFTAADISLTVLLSRLSLLGLDTYYFPKDSCPQVHHYYTQVQKRPAYLNLQTEITNIRLSLLWENVKSASPYVAGLAGIGMVAAGAFWFYNKSRWFLCPLQSLIGITLSSVCLPVHLSVKLIVNTSTSVPTTFLLCKTGIIQGRSIVIRYVT